jgi:ribonuclease R
MNRKTMTDRELLRHIERSPGQRAGYKHLVREFGLGGGRERRLLLEHLARLTASGQLTKVDREQWAIARSAAVRDNLIAGRLDLHRDGFGFVRIPSKPDGGQGAKPTPAARTPTDTGDVFIPPTEINGAMQGDQVLVELDPPKADGRSSGRILRVLTRRNPTVVGIFHYAQSGRLHERQQGHQVIPFDEKMTQPILIPSDEALPEAVASVSPHRVLGEQSATAPKFDDLEGLVVDVEITEWPTPTRAARGRVIEVLGDQDAFGVDVEMVIRKHQLPRIFPENVLEEARAVAHIDPAALAGRRDFRHQPIVTIDGETARDFDDAVLVREHANGEWDLEVHIADVAEYVRPGAALDLEARLRGNSVYFPDRAIPMLPHELSSGICSLRPDEDRLVLSCLMRIDERGDVLDYEVVEGVIRSARRMTYTQVAAILGNEGDGPEGELLIPGDEKLRAEFAPFVPEFQKMKRLAQLLNAKRDKRGSIDFDLPEPIIEFDDFGAMKSVTRSTRNWAHRLIEEFMLAANESVASWLEGHAPSIYRIHEKPEPRRILEFEDTAATFGYSLGIGNLPVKRFAMKNDRRDAFRGNDRFGGRGRNGRGAKSTSTRAIEIPEDIPVTPHMYQKLAAKIAGKPEERILSYLMLRSLKQARYSEENEGHFALAAPCYTHFTSPIRRYPDLIIHRIAKTLLRSGISGHGKLAPGGPHNKQQGPTPWNDKGVRADQSAQGKKHKPEKSAHPGSRNEISGLHRFGAGEDDTAQPSALEQRRSGDGPAELIPESELAAIAQESSENERRAAAAERELVEWKKIKFMRDRVGEEFRAMILSATKYGLFVELDSLFVEGLVPLGSLGALDGDYYIYHETTREILGEHWGRKFQMGQHVKVQLDRIDAVEKRLQFSIVLKEDEQTPSRFPKLGKAKAAKPKKERKRKSMQPSTPKSRIPAPKGTGKKPKRKR